MEKNKYLKIWIFSVIFLLGLCFLDVGTKKGTDAATNNPKVTLDCPTGYQPNNNNDGCIKRDQTLTRSECENQGGSYAPSNGNDTCVFVSSPNKYTIEVDLNYNYTDSTHPNGYITSRDCDTNDGNTTSCKIQLHHPTRTGYDFKGWTKEKDCSYDATKYMGNEITISTTSDFRTLYACWESSSQNCYVTEEGNYVWMDDSRDEFVTEEGGTFKKVDNSKCESSGSTTKTCFKCSTDSNNTKYDVNAPTSGCAGTWQSTQESACDKTYTAQFKDTASSYTKQTTCTIKASETDTKTTCGAPLPTEKPQQEGKTFKGWTETSNTCNNPKTTGTISVGKNGKTLYACWETSVKVTFNPTSEGTISGKNKGETKDFTCTYKSGEDSCKLSENPTATISGREFLGWSKSSECTEYTKDIKSIEFKENTTFTACYAEPVAQDKTVKATFDANGGILSGKTTDTCTIISGNSSCKITSLPTATYTGKTFGGWGGSKTCQSGQMNEVNLTANKTFYACWNEINDGDDEPPLDEPSEEPSDKPSINPPYNQDDDDQNDDDNQNDNDQNVDNNPGTGEIAIFIVWIAAFFAIGYSIYYYKEIKGN